MASHVLRDLPKQHVQHTLRPYFGYPKNGAKSGKFRFLPLTEVSYIGANGSNGHKKEHGIFASVGGESLVWGIFRRQVYRTVHPLIDGKEVLLKKDQKFIVAWPGNGMNGGFRPLSLWKGVMGKGSYTHYHVVYPVETSSGHTSFYSAFVRRELIDSQLPVSKN